MSELSKQMQRDIVLIDELLSNSTEKGCVEFKHNNESPEMIGKLCSALSNAARIEEKDFRNYIHPYQQLGSQFNPDKQTSKISWQVLKTAIHQIGNMK
jgi:hypothetical protein